MMVVGEGEGYLNIKFNMAGAVGEAWLLRGSFFSQVVSYIILVSVRGSQSRQQPDHGILSRPVFLWTDKSAGWSWSRRIHLLRETDILIWQTNSRPKSKFILYFSEDRISNMNKSSTHRKNKTVYKCSARKLLFLNSREKCLCRASCDRVDCSGILNSIPVVSRTIQLLSR